MWTHVLYPLVAEAAALVAGESPSAGTLPRVAVIVAAHDEAPVIEARIANLLALDYPHDRLEVVVTSDASTDRTDELAEAAGARVIRIRAAARSPHRTGRSGETDSEIVAFSDANASWDTDALRRSSSPSPTRRWPMCAAS